MFTHPSKHVSITVTRRRQTTIG